MLKHILYVFDMTNYLAWAINYSIFHFIRTRSRGMNIKIKLMGAEAKCLYNFMVSTKALYDYAEEIGALKARIILYDVLTDAVPRHKDLVQYRKSLINARGK